MRARATVATIPPQPHQPALPALPIVVKANATSCRCPSVRLFWLKDCARACQVNAIARVTGVTPPRPALLRQQAPALARRLTPLQQVQAQAPRVQLQLIGATTRRTRYPCVSARQYLHTTCAGHLLLVDATARATDATQPLAPRFHQPFQH